MKKLFQFGIENSSSRFLFQENPKNNIDVKKEENKNELNKENSSNYIFDKIKNDPSVENKNTTEISYEEAIKKGYSLAGPEATGEENSYDKHHRRIMHGKVEVTEISNPENKEKTIIIKPSVGEGSEKDMFYAGERNLSYIPNGRIINFNDKGIKISDITIAEGNTFFDNIKNNKVDGTYAMNVINQTSKDIYNWAEAYSKKIDDDIVKKIEAGQK